MEKSLYSKEYSLLLKMLRDTREASGVTQEEMATRLNATQSFVSKCERGERRLDVVELHHWCGALGKSFPSFLKKFDEACRKVRKDH